MHDSASLRRPVLLYDGECRLCRFTARVVSRLDRRTELALLPLQDGAAKTLLTPLAEDERLATWRLARPDGSLSGCGSGIPDLLETMGLTRTAGRLLRRVPVGALDALYRAAARNRGALGRLVPDGAAPRRYP